MDRETEDAFERLRADRLHVMTAPRRQRRPPGATQLRIVIVGHVDHGKSTLVGRLIYDTGSLPEGKLEAIKAMCERRGMPFEWAFLMDAFQAERDQGITIDTAQIWLRTRDRATTSSSTRPATASSSRT